MLTIEKRKDHYCGHFTVMASPCELLIETDFEQVARKITQLAFSEAERIEAKYSRYRSGNICYQINHSQGNAVSLDDETLELIRFADQCFHMSDGLFDITSGILRKIWHFEPNKKIPSQRQVNDMLKFVGWGYVRLQGKELKMKPDMEIDFGGIGKEYAVDKCGIMIQEMFPDISVLINFGGDITVTKKPTKRSFWVVGIDDGSGDRTIAIEKGAVATSGDANRFLVHENRRYGHIINPKTGYPPLSAPHSVTVARSTCVEAGFLSTLAILQGKHARSFLNAQNVLYWMT